MTKGSLAARAAATRPDPPDPKAQAKARAYLALRHLLGYDSAEEFAMFADMLGLIPGQKSRPALTKSQRSTQARHRRERAAADAAEEDT